MLQRKGYSEEEEEEWVTNHSQGWIAWTIWVLHWHDPYIFVSYARLDKSFVYNALQIFHDAKVNVWYDEGIPPRRVGGGDCSGYQKSSLLSFSMSPQAVSSRFVRNEINYAVSLDKNILHLPEETCCLNTFACNLTSHWGNGSGLASKSMHGDSDPDQVRKKMGIGRIQDGWFRISRALILASNYGVIGAGYAFSRYPPWLKIRKRLKAKMILCLHPPQEIEDEGCMASNLEPSPDPNIRGEPGIHGLFALRLMRILRPRAFKEFLKIHTLVLYVDSTRRDFIWVPYAEEQRVVKVTQGFWMGKYPVTQEVYPDNHGNESKFCWKITEGHEDNLPVNNVSWLDAVSFCKALLFLPAIIIFFPKQWISVAYWSGVGICVPCRIDHKLLFWGWSKWIAYSWMV